MPPIIDSLQAVSKTFTNGNKVKPVSAEHPKDKCRRIMLHVAFVFYLIPPANNVVPNTTATFQYAISVRQPWAWLIIRPDLTDPEERRQAIADGLIKDRENRTWRSNFRGSLFIHAAKGFTYQEYCDCQQFLVESDIHPHITLPDFESFQLGGIIGSVYMEACLAQSQSKWFTGPFGFHFTQQQILPFQPLRGLQKIFRVAV